MEENNQLEELVKLTKAVKALSRSVEKAVMTHTEKGAGSMMVKSYKSLHRRAVELLPDDYFIADALVLELKEDASEQEMIAQVRLAVSQLQHYLQDMVRSERPLMEDVGDWQSFGRDIQDHVLNLTKRALRRAMTHVDIGINEDEEDEGSDEKPKRDREHKKRRIMVNFGFEPPIPPVPPTPPTPPTPPFPPKPPTV